MVTILKVGYNAFKLAFKAYQAYYYSHNNGYIAGCGNNEIVYSFITNDNTNFNDKASFIAEIVPTAIEVFNEGDVIAYPTLIYNSSVLTNYDIGDLFMYVGTALYGTADSDSKWTIIKYELLNGLVISKRSTAINAASWTNRVLETYY